MNAALNTSAQELVTSKLMGWLCALCFYALAALLVVFTLHEVLTINEIIARALLDSLLAHRFDDAALLAQHVVSIEFLLCAAFIVMLLLARKRITSYLQSKHAVREATAKLKTTADQAAALFDAAVTLFASVLARVTLTLTFKPRIQRAPEPPPLPARRLLHASIQQKHHSASLRTARA